MVHFQVLTIFPELFETFKSVGLLSRGIEQGAIDITTSHLRDFAINTHGQIDDTPYGGGSGMVLRPEPADAAIKKAKELDPSAKVVLFTPRGQVFTQNLARKLANQAQENNSGFILLCCRYEGVDERIAKHYVDLEINIGDYIMMGGEAPAMSFIESVGRLVPGVLGNPESQTEESFENILLEYPQYTKPSEYQGMKVPDVLLSGHHAQIEKWRHEQALEDTKTRRPDLYQKSLTARSLKPRVANPNIALALIHYPVLDKQGAVITSSITNIDLHDIARSCRTYNIESLYIVHPTKILRRLSEKICEHWDTGYGSTYNPNRKEALSLLRIVPELNDAIMDLKERFGRNPVIVTTSARAAANTTTYDDFRIRLSNSEDPHLLLFGTGWGLTDEVMNLAQYRLEPINGRGNYNHLSVRSAAAIILDRLLG